MKKGSPMPVIRTDRPGLVFIESERHGGQFYPITGFGTVFPVCHCPGSTNHGACKHEIQALDMVTEETNLMPAEDTTRAVAIAERSSAVVRAEEQRLVAAAALRGWNDLVTLGSHHIKSGFAPKDVTKPEQAAMILLKAIELDIPITAAYDFVAVVHGRPRLMGQMVIALISRSGKGHIHFEKTDATECIAVGYREGRRPVRIRFGIEDANRAGLLRNENVKQYPADHWRYKAAARIGRILFPDVLSGMEVIDAGGELLDSEGQLGGGNIEILEGEYRPVETAQGEPVDAETGEIQPDGGVAQPAEQPPFKRPDVGPTPAPTTTAQPPLELGETDGSRMQALFDEAVEALTDAGLTPGALSLPMKDAIGTGQWSPENLMRWVEETGQSPAELVRAVAARH